MSRYRKYYDVPIASCLHTFPKALSKNISICLEKCLKIVSSLGSLLQRSIWLTSTSFASFCHLQMGLYLGSLHNLWRRSSGCRGRDQQKGENKKGWNSLEITRSKIEHTKFLASGLTPCARGGAGAYLFQEIRTRTPWMIRTLARILVQIEDPQINGFWSEACRTPLSLSCNSFMSFFLPCWPSPKSSALYKPSPVMAMAELWPFWPII